MSAEEKMKLGKLPDGIINIDSKNMGPETNTLRLGTGDRVKAIIGNNSGEVSAIGETQFDTFFQSLLPIIEAAKKEAIERKRDGVQNSKRNVTKISMRIKRRMYTDNGFPSAPRKGSTGNMT